MTHRGSSAPSHPSGLEPGEVNRDRVCFPSKVMSVCLAMARWPDLPYRSVLFHSQQYLESNPTGRQKREYKKALCTLHVHIGQETTWCKKTGITFKEDLSLGPSSAIVLMNRKFPLCYPSPCASLISHILTTRAYRYPYSWTCIRRQHLSPISIFVSLAPGTITNIRIDGSENVWWLMEPIFKAFCIYTHCIL